MRRRYPAQAGADIQELPDAGLADQVRDHTAQERPRHLGHLHDLREGRPDLLTEPAVGGEVVLPAQKVVPHPGRVRPVGVQPAQQRLTGDRCGPAVRVLLAHGLYPTVDQNGGSRMYVCGEAISSRIRSRSCGVRPCLSSCSHSRPTVPATS